MHVGPLALVVDREPSRQPDREFREEIRRLEVERREVRDDRMETRRPSRYREEDREIIIAAPEREERRELVVASSSPVERKRRLTITRPVEKEVIIEKKKEKGKLISVTLVYG